MRTVTLPALDARSRTCSPMAWTRRLSAPSMNQVERRLPERTIVSSMLVMGVSPTPPLTRTTGQFVVVSKKKSPAGGAAQQVPGKAWSCSQFDASPAGTLGSLALDGNPIGAVSAHTRSSSCGEAVRCRQIQCEPEILSGLWRITSPPSTGARLNERITLLSVDDAFNYEVAPAIPATWLRGQFAIHRGLPPDKDFREKPVSLAPGCRDLRVAASPNTSRLPPTRRRPQMDNAPAGCSGRRVSGRFARLSRAPRLSILRA